MDVPTPDAAISEAIRHSSSLPELADFALHQHGFSDADGGFGIHYANDLDEFDRRVDGIDIPVGHVRVYGFWGPPDGYELLVAESHYLDTLSAFLDQAGHLEEAGRVRQFRLNMETR